MRTYLVQTLWAPTSNRGHQIGFDLATGVTPTGRCGPGLPSIYGDDGVADAALNDLLPTGEGLSGFLSTDDLLRWAIAEGRLAWAIQLEGSEMRLGIASPRDGLSPPLDETLRPRAGERYAFLPVASAAREPTGPRVRARFDDVTLPAAGVPWLPTETVRTWWLAADEGGPGLRRGVLGGSLDLEVLLSEAARLGGGPILDAIEEFLGNYCDLAPGPGGGCTRMGFALAFEAVPIVVEDE